MEELRKNYFTGGKLMDQNKERKGKKEGDRVHNSNLRREGERRSKQRTEGKM